MNAVNRKYQSCFDLPSSIRRRMMASQPRKPARKSSIAVLLPRLFFKTSPSSFPAVGFFVGIFSFPLFPDGSKTVVLCQGYFSVLVVNALPSWSSRSSKSALSTVQMACQ
jgi:hypothetical protein